MDKKNKMNSIIERWKADVESYRNGALVEYVYHNVKLVSII